MFMFGNFVLPVSECGVKKINRRRLNRKWPSGEKRINLSKKG